MKPIIAVPSYNRPEAKIFEKLRNLGLSVFVFIRKEQYDQYKYLETWGFTLVAIHSSIEELGMTRRYLVYWLNKHGYEWAFMFDDDIAKVERLGPKPDGAGWNSLRILAGSPTSPRIEAQALRLWYQQAQKYNIVLSSPNHRAYDRFSHGNNIRVNKSAIIQCCLLHIPSIIAVGNYTDTRKVGVEDYYIQYQLMKQGYLTGKMGNIEFDAPNIGNIADGTGDRFRQKYERFVKCFKEKVCDDPELIGTKITSTGVPSIQFKWKNWGGYTIELEARNETTRTTEHYTD